MDSSDSSNKMEAKSGNTKQISPAIRWCFTLNNYTQDELNYVNKTCSDSSKYYIFGFEVGENNTPHLQGYIEFKSKKRPLSVFSLNRIHWEKSKGNRLDNFNYCSKGGDYVINGVRQKPIKVITELRPWQKIIYDKLFIEDDRLIHWCFETTGDVGKTALLRYIAYHHEKETLILCGKATDMKNGVLKFKEKHGYWPKNIIFNLPRSFNCEHLSLAGIEEIKDGLFYCGKYEGGQCLMNPPNMVIMSNTPFEDLNIDQISPKRWNIIDIRNIIELGPES